QSLVDDRPPLVFVDGMRVNQTEDDYWASMTGPVAPGPLRLSDLSVEDIESVEVVGPAGAAVYGPGAAGGVLLIRTKRGRAGPPRWEAYAAGGVRSEQASWPANYGGVDVDNPNDLYRHPLHVGGAGRGVLPTGLRPAIQPPGATEPVQDGAGSAVRTQRLGGLESGGLSAGRRLLGL